MRDAFGEIDPDEIDIIDADPGAFGPAPFTGDGPADGATDAAVVGRARRRWLVPAVVATVVGLVAVGVVLWQPWAGESGAVSFPAAGAAGEPELTDQLVFGAPPAELSSAQLGRDEADIGLGRFDDSVGYFFAEPGAHLEFDGTGGVWAAFLAAPSDSSDAPPIEEGNGSIRGTVQGAPATIRSDPGTSIEINFGPVDGLIYSVISSGMSQADTLALAEVVSVEGGVPTVGDSTVLGDMQPMGSLADYSDVFSLLLAFSQMAFPQSGLVAVGYGDADPYVVANLSTVNDDLSAMMRFAFGDDQRVVHGQPALVVPPDRNGIFGVAVGTMVVWQEGGRLVMVAGPGDADTILALAETVRPATDEEWATVVQAAADTPNPLDSFMPPPEPATTEG